MLELRENLGLAPQPRQPIRIGRQLCWQHLDRHVAIEPGITAPINLAHAAGAQRFDDLVLAELRAGVQSVLRGKDARGVPAFYGVAVPLRRSSRCGGRDWYCRQDYP